MHEAPQDIWSSRLTQMQPGGGTKTERWNSWTDMETMQYMAAHAQVALHMQPTMVCGPHSVSATAWVVPLTTRTQRGADLVDTPRLAGSLALVMQGAEQGPQSLAASQNTPRHGSGSHSITEGGETRPRPTH